MSLSIEKTFILSGAVFGSIFLFTTSLVSINNIILRPSSYDNKNVDQKHINFLLIANGATMAFSAYTFSHFVYIATK